MPLGQQSAVCSLEVHFTNKPHLRQQAGTLKLEAVEDASPSADHKNLNVYIDPSHLATTSTRSLISFLAAFCQSPKTLYLVSIHIGTSMARLKFG